MMTRPTFRILTAGFLASALAACGDDGGKLSSASDGQTEGDTASQATVDATAGGDSATETSQPTTGTPTTGVSDSATQGTTEGTATAAETEGVTEGVPDCGNGVQEGSEECDDGNDVAGDGCEPTCTITAVCGNNNVEAGEACDDGNTEDGDECSADCQTATPLQDCGNGTVERPEQCDDGNVVPGDGCEPDCTFSPADCGNGIKEAGEECDDGNTVDGGPGDFCLNNCTTYFPASCQAPANYVVCDDAPDVISNKADKNNALKAIGICNSTPADSIMTSNFQFSQAVDNSWQVAKGFGTYTYDHDMDANTPPQLLYSPREGAAFLMLSTGTITPPNGQGVVVEPANSQTHDDNFNPDGGVLPAPFNNQNGSNNGAGGTPFKNCDNGVPNGDRDCSDTLQAQWAMTNGNANDRIYFTFNTKVPAGTFGYTFDFVFCSAEWPTWVGSSYNDLLIAYQVDPTPDNPNAMPPVDPYSGNVTFIPDPNNPASGLPLTITALDPYYDGPGYTFAEPQLQGTGFEQHACTDWFTAKGGVQPGAEITIGFFLADMSDQYLTTVALLDNFRWDCEGCIPNEVDDCGIQPM
ncbi:choice-of-anchor L domain-containing protein [Nannocystis pusilla]|uniref:Choice-of-anchor L domain-containing protein n=1 Tax=Nannocystis pusilla TaxID=889268 RepID=A0ABS7U1Q6_9BACT|nr:choice-of-anchor L domain-containing protein [Nannocystis pusilla]MBZ5714380.1 choice-of-anchor L domain-containing protein [Nannocystis pusilla]